VVHPRQLLLSEGQSIISARGCRAKRADHLGGEVRATSIPFRTRSTLSAGDEVAGNALASGADAPDGICHGLRALHRNTETPANLHQIDVEFANP
jgi:hypothetical protein